MDSEVSKTNELLLELVNYQYGYIGYCIGYKKEMTQKNIWNLLKEILKSWKKVNLVLRS